MAWLHGVCATVAPIRSAWATGGIIRSSVTCGYQLGLTRQAAWPIRPPRASRPHGTCESAMNAASSAGTSAANDSWELRPVQEQLAVDRGQDRRLRPVDREGAEERVDGLALVGCERGDVHERGDLVVSAGLGDVGARAGGVADGAGTAASCAGVGERAADHPAAVGAVAAVRAVV